MRKHTFLPRTATEKHLCARTLNHRMKGLFFLSRSPYTGMMNKYTYCKTRRANVCGQGQLTTEWVFSLWTTPHTGMMRKHTFYHEPWRTSIRKQGQCSIYYLSTSPHIGMVLDHTLLLLTQKRTFITMKLQRTIIYIRDFLVSEYGLLLRITPYRYGHKNAHLLPWNWKELMMLERTDHW